MKWIWEKIGELLIRKVMKHFVEEEIKRQLEQKECLEETLNNCLNQIRETIESEEKERALQCFPCYLRAIPIKNFDERITEAIDLGKQLIPFYEEHQLRKMLIDEDLLGRFLEGESGAVRVKVDELIRELQPGYLRFELICKLAEGSSSIGKYKVLLGQFEDMIQKGLIALDNLDEVRRFLTSTHEWKDYEQVKEEVIRLEGFVHRMDDFLRHLGQLACVPQDKLERQIKSFIDYAKGLNHDFISHQVLPILKSRYGEYECVNKFLKQYDRRNEGSERRYVKKYPVSFEYSDASGKGIHVDGISDMMTVQGFGAFLRSPLVPGQIGIVEIKMDDRQKIEKKSKVVHNRCFHKQLLEEGYQYYAGFRLEGEDNIPQELMNAMLK